MSPSSAPHSATLAVRLDAPELVLQAIEIECNDGPEGSACTLEVREGQLMADITAKDVSTLRAAINNVVRLLDTASRIA